MPVDCEAYEESIHLENIAAKSEDGLHVVRILVKMELVLCEDGSQRHRICGYAADCRIILF